jgi:hypothetical protein
MSQGSNGEDRNTPRWRYLALAALVLVVSGALLVLLWQVPRFLAEPAPPSVISRPLATQTLTPLLTQTHTPLPATPTPSPSTPTPTFTVREPIIRTAEVSVNDASAWIDFHISAQVPPDREIEEIRLWYDTEAGRQTKLVRGAWSDEATAVYRLDATVEGLTRTLTNTHELDYWWLVRDTAGQSVRLGGIAELGHNLLSLVTPPAPEPPPLDFSWGVSATKHYELYYVPGTAAERDRFQLGTLAEASLAHISSSLDLVLDDQMKVYLVPRIFWQGGAAYAGKIQLISYLDRNYTGIETWSYFTHEGTHALAQDLLQPKENGGGPDGVLVEGLAVWASDGHYRREPLDIWAAVVAASGEYLPLAELREGPFYEFQHETSYLEGGSFVKFLVERYGLDRFKVLYGQATGEAEHDGELVLDLYGVGYEELESQWLSYLAGQVPTAQEADTWWLKVRSFDLMRRYETELDPDARLLPGSAPPEWTSDTLRIYLHRVKAPLNVALETALIAAQELIYSGELDRATQVLDDVEEALDSGAERLPPSIEARLSILDLLFRQDRAILRADTGAYLETVAPGSSLAAEEMLTGRLGPPFLAYEQELVRLRLGDDGLGADGVVLVHGQVLDGEWREDGELFEVRFIDADGRWLMASRELVKAVVSSLPAAGD